MTAGNRRRWRAAAWVLVCVMLSAAARGQQLPGAGPGAGTLPLAIRPGDVAAQGSYLIDETGQVRPLSKDNALALLGLADASHFHRWSGSGALKEEEESRERVIHYVIGLTHPVEVGAVVFYGGGQTVAVLKAGASLPDGPSGDAANDALWEAMEIPPRQPAWRAVPLPAGAAVKALRFTHDLGRGGSSLEFVRLLKPRVFNATTLATAYGESEYRSISTGGGAATTFSADRVVSGVGSWQNVGPDGSGHVVRPPISDINPAWFIVAWKEPRTLSGLALWGTLSDFDIEVFDGAATVNPRAATEREWKKLRGIKERADAGAHSMVTVEFNEAVTTRGLRLLAKRSSMGRIALINALHVYEPLGDRPAPVPATAEAFKPPVEVRYTLEKAGSVTLAIDDAQGRRVRNIVARELREAGENVETWDLNDEDGNLVPPGNYTWKLITLPGAGVGGQLPVRYEMTVYPNVTEHSPDRTPWQTVFSGADGWMADHSPPMAAAYSPANGGTLAFGAPVSENGVSLIVCDTNGVKQWAVPSFASFTGSWWLAADDKTIFNVAPLMNAAGQLQIDPSSEGVWGIDITTKQVREVARLEPTTDRSRGVRGTAAHNGELYLSVRAAEDWLARAASAGDVAVERCFPVYKERRKERHAYEVVPDPRNDFLRLFRLVGTPPGLGGEGRLVWLRSSEGRGARQHIVLTFNKPVAIGSAVFPVPQDPTTRVILSVHKPDAPYPPNPGIPGQWTDFERQATGPWDVAVAAPGTVTRALRVTFLRGEDDIFTQTDEAARFDTDAAMKESIDAGIEEEQGLDDAEGGIGNWFGEIEGMRLIRRRFENVAPAAKVLVNSGKVAPDGSWDALRNEPITEANPGVYALAWDQPRKLRGLAIREIDGKTTKIDVFTGNRAPTEADLKAEAGWEEVASYEQARRTHHSGIPAYDGYARYLDGCVDFGREVETRGVRLRIVEQWADNAPTSAGVRHDQGGVTLDPRRCRVYGVAAMAYLGGEPDDDPRKYHRIEVLDAGSGKITREVHLPSPGPIALTPGQELLAVSGKRIVKVDFAGGNHQPLVEGLDQPQALATDLDGNIYVYDRGPKVVRVFDPAGKPLRTIGEEGGYVVGPWNPRRLNDITALAADNAGHLWAVDTTYYPKRISRWSLAGEFQQDYLGNTRYGGAGTMDPWDTHRVFYGPMEFEIDLEAGRSRLKNLTWLGDTPAGDEIVRIDGRQYLVTRIADASATQPCGIVYRYEGDHLVPAAAVGSAAGFAPLRNPAVHEGLGFKTLRGEHKFIWCDRSGDGAVQADEVELTPVPPQGYRDPNNFNRDLGIQAGRHRYEVKEYLPTGVPVYVERVIEGLPMGDAQTGAGLMTYRTDHGFYSMNESSQSGRERGFDAEGRLMWTYPAGGSSVGGIGRADKYEHGQVICQFSVAGHATAHAGDLGEFLVFHTNLGGWNVMTADGLLAARIFRDQRQPQAKHWSMPEHHRGLPLDDAPVGQEHFSGFFMRSETDNKYYAVAGHNHLSIAEVLGMDTFKRMGAFDVSLDDVKKTQTWLLAHQEQEVYERAPVLDCVRVAAAPDIDGVIGDDWKTPAVALRDKAEYYDPTGSIRIGYDDNFLYVGVAASGMGPFKNSGEQWDRLFKTGAAVDLQLSTDPDAPADRQSSAAGDLRLLAPFKGKPVAVLYRAVVPGTPADKVWEVASPVGRAAFDEVRIAQEVRVAVQMNENQTAYALEAAIPLKLLGLSPKANIRLKADWGVLATDASGNAVLRRIYWANHATGITADIPTEARLNPNLWGTLLLHATPPGAVGKGQPTLDPTTGGPGGDVDDSIKDFEDELDDL